MHCSDCQGSKPNSILARCIWFSISWVPSGEALPGCSTNGGYGVCMNLMVLKPNLRCISHLVYLGFGRMTIGWSIPCQVCFGNSPGSFIHCWDGLFLYNNLCGTKNTENMDWRTNFLHFINIMTVCKGNLS